MKNILKFIKNLFNRFKVLKFLIEKLPYSILMFTMIFTILSVFKGEDIINKVNNFKNLSHTSRTIISAIILISVVIGIGVFTFLKEKTKNIFIIIFKAFIYISIAILQIFIIAKYYMIFKIVIYSILIIMIFLLVQFIFLTSYYINKIIKENTDYNNIMLLIAIIGLLTGIIIGII